MKEYTRYCDKCGQPSRLTLNENESLYDYGNMSEDGTKKGFNCGYSGCDGFVVLQRIITNEILYDKLTQIEKIIRSDYE